MEWGGGGHNALANDSIGKELGSLYAARSDIRTDHRDYRTAGVKWQSVLAKYFAASPDEFRQKTRGAYRRLTKRNIFLTRRQARDRSEFSETRKLPRHFGRRHPFFFFSFCSGARRKPVIKWPLFFYERATWAPPCGPQFRLPRPDAFGTAGALRVIFFFISPGFFYIRIYSSFLLSLGEPRKSFRTPAAKNDSAK